MLEKLDPIQNNAVNASGVDVLCDSKAGSGKTRILMNRCLYLMDHGVKPEEIMLVTFTNRAAKEMQDRICRLSPNGNKILCGTFHYIAMLYIREYAEEVGFTKDFSVLSPEDAKKLMKATIKTYQICYPDTNIKGMEHIKVNTLLNAYSRARNLHVDFRTFVLEKLTFKFGEADVAETIIEMYAELKKLNNCMDFDDLLQNFRDLLSVPQTNDKIAGRFKHILVDEYQDINRVQNSIIFFLRGYDRNLFVVGDPYQCIYGFRGSKIEYIRDFADNYSAETFCVNNNYRSIQPILDVANEITKGKTPMSSMVVGQERPCVHLSKNNFDQAAFIADQVKQKIARGEDPTQIAILIRNTLDESLIESELTKRRIGYVLRAGFSYFERAHIKDVLMFLVTLKSNKNSMAMKRVLSLFDGIGAKTADKIISEAQAKNILLGDMLQLIYNKKFKLSTNARAGALIAHELYQRFSGIVLTDARQAISRFLYSFYEQYLTATFPDDFEERIADVKRLAELAKAGSNNHDFLAFVNEAMIDTSVNSKETGDVQKKIVISTIHRAKGLEWDNVIICNMENRFYKDRPDMPDDEFEASENERLAYVAVTRARKSLLITSTSSSWAEAESGNYRKNASMLACITRSRTLRRI